MYLHTKVKKRFYTIVLNQSEALAHTSCPKSKIAYITSPTKSCSLLVQQGCAWTSKTQSLIVKITRLAIPQLKHVETGLCSTNTAEQSQSSRIQYVPH